MATIEIPDDAAAALVAAGSKRLGPKSRAALENRITRFGVSPKAHNIGGIRCGRSHVHQSGEGCGLWRGEYVEVFPSYADAAARLIKLCRIATGETGAPSQGGGVAGFRSIAPEEGETPLEVSHLSGPTDDDSDERRALWAVITQAIGGDEIKAIARVQEWRGASDEIRQKARARLATETGEQGITLADALDELAGTGASATARARAASAASVGAAKKAKKKKPTPSQVVHAQAQAAKAKKKAKAAHDRILALKAQMAQMQAQQGQQQGQDGQQDGGQGQGGPQDGYQGGGEQDGNQAPQDGYQGEPDGNQAPPAAPPSSAPVNAPPGAQAAPAPGAPASPATMTLADLVKALAAQQAEALQAKEAADEASGLADELSGLFGVSDASAHAFQELQAGWKAVEDSGPILPDYKRSHDAWVVFRDKWLRGEEDETNLNPAIAELGIARKTLEAKDPKWKDKIPQPKGIDIETEHPMAATIDKAARGNVIVDFITDPAKGAIAKAGDMAKGKAPWYYYLGAGAAVVAVGAVVVKVAKPW